MRRVTFVGIFIAYLFLSQSSDVLAKEVPFTLEDRDRLIRVEAKLEGIDKRFDQPVSIFIGIVAAFAGIVAVTIGFAIWDRKTALAPAMRRSQEHQG